MPQSTERPVKILFVCIGNACRSPMAEGWANHYGNGKVEVYSAGSHAYGAIISDTYTAMKAKGITLEGQRSKSVRDVPLAEMDIVVRMGDEVEINLPEGFNGRVVEWDIPDPYARGSETFRTVRDLIERQVLALLAEIPAPEKSA